MDDPLVDLTDSELIAIAAALKSERLSPPFRPQGLQRFVEIAQAGPVASALQKLVDQGFTAEMVASVIQLLLNQRAQLAAKIAEIELVTSGPEADGVANRDTAIVVRELFAGAKRSVLVVGYAVYQGKRVFEALAKRMTELPDLDVTMCLDISRQRDDTTPTEILLSRFVQRFKDHQWPAGSRFPKIYYDPRSVEGEPIRSSLHAKAIVIDRNKTFVSSANFTEAGQDRNIELGVCLASAELAAKIVSHFQALIDRKLLVRCQ